MAKVLANSVDPDQMLQNAASDKVCTVFQLPFKGFPDYNGLWPCSYLQNIQYGIETVAKTLCLQGV